MKRTVLYAPIVSILILTVVSYLVLRGASDEIEPLENKTSYWFVLHRKSNVEMLYQGVAGDTANSVLVRTFTVKSGIPGMRPTPLPSLLGRDYWILTEKLEAFDNLETGPYFLALDIPYSEIEPYGPTPYLECNGQCNWELPGAFGLHGTGDDPNRLLPEDPGSSGCVRHSNEDITYLYNLLDLSKEVRYYIQDI